MRRAALRLTAALAAILAASGCEPNVTTPVEASERIKDSYAWMAESRLCPVDLMRADMRVNGLRDMNCGDAELPMCFRRCRKGDTDSCFWLASTLEHADPGDPAAQALYQRACTLGEPSGCTNRAASMALENRKDAGIQKCAARTFEKTCALKDAWGCAMYGMALHEGHGLPRDDQRALGALDAACLDAEPSAPACSAARRITTTIRESGAGASSGSGGP